MKKTLFIMLWILLVLPAVATTTEFTYTYQGKSLKYHVINEESKICSVANETSYKPGYSVSGDLVIPSFALGYKVISIEKSAFYGWGSLISITIPSSVTSIGDYAFSNCTSLENLVFEDGENTLQLGYGSGYELFRDCRLKTLYLGRNLSYKTAASGSESPFSHQTGLTTVTIGNLVTSIGIYAFFGCSTLTSITIPKSVISIGDSAFSDCNCLKSLTFEDGEKALKLGYSHKGFFNDCPLENLYLGRNLVYSASPSIGYSAFCDKTTLKEVTIGNSVTSIGDNAFSGCRDLKKLIFEDGEAILELGDNKGSNGLFSDCMLETLYIGRNLSYKSDNHSPFSNQTALNEVKIGKSVTSIGRYAFSGCSGLASVTIPNSVTSIGSSAFSGCGDLASVTIPNSVTSIGSSAFSGCGDLASITIPNSVISIGDQAFRYCFSLENLIFEEGEKNLELGYNGSYEGLFSDCPVETLYLGRNLSYGIYAQYGYSPFYNKTSLTAVTIGYSVTFIGFNAFRCCSGLSSITIPSSVTSLGESVLYGCSGLKHLILEDGGETLSFGYFEKFGLFGDFFGDCQLETLYLGRNISYKKYLSQDSSPFCNQTALTEVTIGSTVTSIGDYAFAGCRGLRSVTSLNTTPPKIGSTTFDSEVESSATLHVQKGCLVYYWLDPVWKQFMNMADDILCLQAIPAATYGDGEIDLAQYAPDGVALTYETSDDDVVRIDGTKMRIVGAGTATVGAMLAEEGTPMEIMGQMRQFVVKQADLTVTVDDITIEEGQPLPDFTFLAEGLKYDDTIDDIENRPMPICEVDENTPAGEYVVDFTEGSDRNYRITTRQAKVTVTKYDSLDAIAADADEMIEVYQPNGVLIYKGLRSEVSLVKGIYIVRQGNVVRKVLVK